MKRSTGIVFLIALILAATVYFFERKHTPASDTTADASKPTFSLKADDIKALSIEHNGTVVNMERRGDGWYLTQPLPTRADQPVANAIPVQLSSLQTERSIATTPDKLNSYGLDHPAISLGFTVNSGAKHKIQFGAK